MNTRDKILNYLKESGISIKWLSQKTKISYTRLWQKLNGYIRLNADDLELICVALGKQPNDFMSCGGNNE